MSKQPMKTYNAKIAFVVPCVKGFISVDYHQETPKDIEKSFREIAKRLGATKYSIEEWKETDVVCLQIDINEAWKMGSDNATI